MSVRVVPDSDRNKDFLEWLKSIEPSQRRPRLQKLVSGGVLRGTSAKAACARLSQRPYVRLERLDLAGGMIAYAKHRQRARDAEVSDESEENRESTTESADERHSSTPEGVGMGNEDRLGLSNSGENDEGNMGPRNAQERELNSDSDRKALNFDAVGENPPMLRTEAESSAFEMDTTSSSDEQAAIVDPTLGSKICSTSRESSCSASTMGLAPTLYDTGRSPIAMDHQVSLNFIAHPEKIPTSLETRKTIDMAPGMERTSLPEIASQNSLEEDENLPVTVSEPLIDGGSCSNEDEDSPTVLFDARSSRSEMPVSHLKTLAQLPSGQNTVRHVNPSPKAVQEILNSRTNTEDITDNSLLSKNRKDAVNLGQPVSHNTVFSKSREQSNGHTLNQLSTGTSAPSNVVSEGLTLPLVLPTNVENQHQNVLSPEEEATMLDFAQSLYLFETEVAKLDSRLIAAQQLPPELIAQERKKILETTFDVVQMRALNVRKRMVKIGPRLGRTFSCALLKHMQKHYGLKYYALSRLATIVKVAINFGVDSKRQAPSIHQNKNDVEGKSWSNISGMSTESNAMKRSRDQHPQYTEHRLQQSQTATHQEQDLPPANEQSLHLQQISNQPQQSGIEKRLQTQDNCLKKQLHNQSQSEQPSSNQRISNQLQARTHKRSQQQKEVCRQQYTAQGQLMGTQQPNMISKPLPTEGQNLQAAKRKSSETQQSQRYVPREQPFYIQKYHQRQTPQQSRHQSGGQQQIYTHQQNTQQSHHLMPHQTNDQQQAIQQSRRQFEGQKQLYSQQQDAQSRQQMMQHQTFNHLLATQQNRQQFESQKQIYSQQQNVQPRQQLAMPQQIYNNSQLSQQNRQQFEGQQPYALPRQQLTIPQQTHNHPPFCQQNQPHFEGQKQTYVQQQNALPRQQLTMPQQSINHQQVIQHSRQQSEGQINIYKEQQQTYIQQQGSQPSRREHDLYLQNMHAQLNQPRICADQSYNQQQLPQHKRYEAEVRSKMSSQHQKTNEQIKSSHVQMKEILPVGSVQRSLPVGQIFSQQQIPGAHVPRNPQSYAIAHVHSQQPMSQGQVNNQPAVLRQMHGNQQTAILDALQHVVTDIMNEANTQQSYTYQYQKSTYSATALSQGYALQCHPETSSLSRSQVQVVDVRPSHQNQGNMHPSHHLSNRCAPTLPPSYPEALKSIRGNPSEQLNLEHNQHGPQVQLPFAYYAQLQKQSLTLQELLHSSSVNGSTHGRVKSQDHHLNQCGRQSSDYQKENDLSPPSRNEEFHHHLSNAQNSQAEHLSAQRRDARQQPKQPGQNVLQCPVTMTNQFPPQHTSLSNTSQTSQPVLNASNYVSSFGSGSSELPVVSQGQECVPTPSADTSQKASKKRRRSLSLYNTNLTPGKLTRTWQQVPYSGDADVLADGDVLQGVTHLEDTSLTSSTHGPFGTTTADAQNDPLQRACSRDSGISSTPEPALYSPFDKDGQLKHDKHGSLGYKQSIGNVNGLLGSRAHENASSDHLTVGHVSVHVSETTPPATDNLSNEAVTLDEPSNAETLSLGCSKSPEETSSVLGTSDDFQSRLKTPATQVDSPPDCAGELDLNPPKNCDKGMKGTTSEDTTSGMLASSVCLSVTDATDDISHEVEGVASVAPNEINSVRDSVIVRMFSPGKGVDVPTSLTSSVAATPSSDTGAPAQSSAKVDSADKALTSTSKLMEGGALLEDPPSPETETSSSSSSLTDPLSPLIDSMPSPSTPCDIDTDFDEFVAIIDEDIEAVTLDAGERCAQCNQLASLMCACMGVCYCSENCQNRHWSSTHSRDCSRRGKDRSESSVTIPLGAPVSN